MKPVYTFIDLETTGLEWETNQIIEIGAVKTDLDKVYGTFQTTVQLYRMPKLPEFIRNLTGLTEDDLKVGMKIGDALEALDNFMYGTTVVAQYVPFDFSFLQDYYIEPPKFICTRFLAKAIEPDKNPGLKYVTERLGIPLNNAHRALGDIEATIEVFKRLKPIAEERGIDYMNKVGDTLERPLRFIPKYAEVVYQG